MKPLPAPHPERDAAPARVRAAMKITSILRRVPRWPKSGNSRKHRGTDAAPRGNRARFCAVADGVWMVRVRFWAPPLAGMLAGEKTAVAPGGRPATLKVTCAG